MGDTSGFKLIKPFTNIVVCLGPDFQTKREHKQVNFHWTKDNQEFRVVVLRGLSKHGCLGALKNLSLATLVGAILYDPGFGVENAQYLKHTLLKRAARPIVLRKVEVDYEIRRLIYQVTIVSAI
ncbi:MAG TPA: hypothetical protein VEA59_01500 [Patescibacteria group bacterium]|nr:hypothetical protein [Patescibacteria group bacterium]